MKNTLLNEAHIKCAVIERLIESGALNDAVLINEMVVANWSRRVDLAVANGKLHAFEIKSDVDTLRRLDGQLATYLQTFDKVTVVTTEKHATQIASMIPNNVELWVASASNQKISLKVVKRGRTDKVSGHDALCSHLTKAEIFTLLKKNGISSKLYQKKESLIQASEIISVNLVRKHLLDCLKNRYKKTHDQFINGLAHRITINDLTRLRKISDLPKISLAHISPENIERRILDYDVFSRKYGELPAGAPVFIRTRKKLD
ncbi:hypothetical protein HNQ50_001915 [Silvimonas terrae]|uniref:Sce7726 family protein n=1 Tax=Silvimonas terrae TaxID=300266 RepID=A0A840RFX6_9NEIS|nr:sce7726 family protein [Silvimonas terrae]MBB5191192.1 hypothetical protein [Silvimonas terrae]